jgi:phosphoglycerate dehydrogenase-like enzyme
MSRRPTVVITGATADDPPPGIHPASSLAQLRYAPDTSSVGPAVEGADAVFAWWRGRELLEAAWPAGGSIRWIQCASDGVDGLLFPELVASDVEVTNARGVFDEPIAEWAIAAILSFRTGLHRSTVDTTRRRWDDDRARRPVAGSHLVVVGPGPIGRAAARRARDLSMTVSLVGRAPRADGDLGPIVGPDALHAELARADHVLDALPLAE